MKNVVATLQFIVSNAKSKNVEACYASLCSKPLLIEIDPCNSIKRKKDVLLLGYDNVGWVKRF